MFGLRRSLYALLGVLIVAGLVTVTVTSLATDQPPQAVILGALAGILAMLAAVLALELDGGRPPGWVTRRRSKGPARGRWRAGRGPRAR